MNIVIIGGGTPRKFGNDFVVRARQQGHQVRVLSHRNYGIQYQDSAVANFSSVEKTLQSFKDLVNDLEHIDLLVYNTSENNWPNQESHFYSTATVNESLYMYGFRIHVIIPHALSIEAMKKMSSTSKIVFMTTDMIYSKERTTYTQMVGYAGGKSYQHQLMLGLANHNNKDVTVSSLSPFFNYNNPKQYKTVFEKAYNHIMTHGSDYNSKVFDCWD